MNAVVDEDLPRSFATMLTTVGFTVYDVRDCGLRGASDSQVFAFAQKKKAILFTADLDFSSISMLATRIHNGIVILRFPNFMANETINQQVELLLREIPSAEYKGKIVMISPHRLRIRPQRIIN